MYSISAGSLPFSQRGSSVSGVVFFIMAMGVFIKIAFAIIPAQLDDRSISQLIAHELSIANSNRDSDKEFLASLNQQLSINAYYDIQPEEMIRFTNNTPGYLAVYKEYTVVNNFFANVDIVSRFEGEITPEDASK